MNTTTNPILTEAKEIPAYMLDWYPHLRPGYVPGVSKATKAEPKQAKPQEFLIDGAQIGIGKNKNRRRAEATFASTFRLQVPYVTEEHWKEETRELKSGEIRVKRTLRFVREAGTIAVGPLARDGNKTMTEPVWSWGRSQYSRKVVRPMAVIGSENEAKATGLGGRAELIIEDSTRFSDNIQFHALLPLTPGWVDAALAKQLTRERNILLFDGHPYLRVVFCVPTWTFPAASQLPACDDLNARRGIIRIAAVQQLPPANQPELGTYWRLELQWPNPIVEFLPGPDLAAYLDCQEVKRRRAEYFATRQQEND